jgi:hypothetical protein
MVESEGTLPAAYAGILVACNPPVASQAEQAEGFSAVRVALRPTSAATSFQFQQAIMYGIASQMGNATAEHPSPLQLSAAWLLQSTVWLISGQNPAT